jgi:hypothetical protein
MNALQQPCDCPPRPNSLNADIRDRPPCEFSRRQIAPSYTNGKPEALREEVDQGTYTAGNAGRLHRPSKLGSPPDRWVDERNCSRIQRRASAREQRPADGAERHGHLYRKYGDSRRDFHRRVFARRHAVYDANLAISLNYAPANPWSRFLDDRGASYMRARVLPVP